MHLTYILESIIAILLVHYRYFVLSGLTISRCRQTSDLPYRDIGVMWKVEVGIIAILFCPDWRYRDVVKLLNYHIAISAFFEKWRLTLSQFCFTISRYRRSMKSGGWHYRYFVLSGLTVSRCRQTSDLPYRDIVIQSIHIAILGYEMNDDIAILHLSLSLY